MLVQSMKRRRPVTFSFVYVENSDSSLKNPSMPATKAHVMDKKECQDSPGESSKNVVKDTQSEKTPTGNVEDSVGLHVSQMSREQVLRLITNSDHSTESGQQMPETLEPQSASSELDDSNDSNVRSSTVRTELPVKKVTELCASIVHLKSRLEIAEELQSLRKFPEAGNHKLKMAKLQERLDFVEGALVREQEKVVALCRENLAMRNGLSDIDKLFHTYLESQLIELQHHIKSNTQIPEHLHGVYSALEQINERLEEQRSQVQKTNPARRENYDRAVLQHRMELYMTRSQTLQKRIDELEAELNKGKTDREREILDRVTALESSLAMAKIKCWQQLTERESLRLEVQDLEERLEDMNEKCKLLAEESDVTLARHQARLERAHKRLHAIEEKFSRSRIK